jgi:hypothetical protein
MGPPSTYKPRRNNYKPLRDLDQNSVREVPDQKITEGKQPSREPGAGAERAPNRPGPERHYGDRGTPGGPMGGGLEPMETYNIQQVRASTARRQAEQAPQQSIENAPTTPRQRTPIKDLVKQTTTRNQEVSDPAIDRTNSPEIER